MVNKHFISLFALLLFLLLASSCTTRKCLECECRRSVVVGCNNPYGSSSFYQDFCDDEEGISEDDFREIEENMIDAEWLCTNN
jgi:hypothetical protein